MAVSSAFGQYGIFRPVPQLALLRMSKQLSRRVVRARPILLELRFHCRVVGPEGFCLRGLVGGWLDSVWMLSFAIAIGKAGTASFLSSDSACLHLPHRRVSLSNKIFRPVSKIPAPARSSASISPTWSSRTLIASKARGSIVTNVASPAHHPITSSTCRNPSPAGLAGAPGGVPLYISNSPGRRCSGVSFMPTP